MISGKKRIIIFIDWFYPGFKAGGPIQSCYNLVQALKNDFDISVVTGDRDLDDPQPYSGIERDKWILQDGYRVIYLSLGNQNYRGIRELLDESGEADHVYLNSMFSLSFTLYPLAYYRLRRRSERTKITIAPRGMLLESALRKKALKKKVFLLLARVLFSQPNLQFHATNAGEKSAVSRVFPGRPCFIANNLGRQDQHPFVNQDKQPGSARMVHIARIDPIKNLGLLLDCLARVRGEVDLHVIGPVDDWSYWESCNQKIPSLPTNIRIHYAGAMKPAELEGILTHAHLFVLLSKGENFGHSIFESWLSGRPVLISDQTPWRNLKDMGIGFDLPLKDQEGIVRCLNEVIGWSQAEFDAYSMESWKFAQRYLVEDKNRVLYYDIFK